MPAITDREPEVELTLQEQQGRSRLPLVNAKVIYIGSQRNKSVSLNGSVTVERIGEGDDEVVTRTPGERNGRTVYDFSTHTSTGKPLPKALFIPMTDPEPELRGRRWVKCEHPMHLWQFQTEPKLRDGYERGNAQSGRGVFRIRASKSDMEVIKEYFTARARAAKQTGRDFVAITTKGNTG